MEREARIKMARGTHYEAEAPAIPDDMEERMQEVLDELIELSREIETEMPDEKDTGFILTNIGKMLMRIDSSPVAVLGNAELFYEEVKHECLTLLQSVEDEMEFREKDADMFG